MSVEEHRSKRFKIEASKQFDQLKHPRMLYIVEEGGV